MQEIVAKTVEWFAKLSDEEKKKFRDDLERPEDEQEAELKFVWEDKVGSDEENSSLNQSKFAELQIVVAVADKKKSDRMVPIEPMSED